MTLPTWIENEPRDCRKTRFHQKLFRCRCGCGSWGAWRTRFVVWIWPTGPTVGLDQEAEANGEAEAGIEWYYQDAVEFTQILKEKSNKMNFTRSCWVVSCWEQGHFGIFLQRYPLVLWKLILGAWTHCRSPQRGNLQGLGRLHSSVQGVSIIASSFWRIPTQRTGKTLQLKWSCNTCRIWIWNRYTLWVPQLHQFSSRWQRDEINGLTPVWHVGRESWLGSSGDVTVVCQSCQARWWVECWICKTVRPCKTARYARKKCKVSRKWKGQRWLEASFGKLWMKQDEIHSGDVPHVMINFIWFYDVVKLNSHTCTLSMPCYSKSHHVQVCARFCVLICWLPGHFLFLSFSGSVSLAGNKSAQAYCSWGLPLLSCLSWRSGRVVVREGVSQHDISSQESSWLRLLSCLW